MLRIRNIPDPVYLRLQVEARDKNTTVAALMRDLIVARDAKKHLPAKEKS
jgi:plasmid stability protein